jgi:hypothetical protein
MHRDTKERARYGHQDQRLPKNDLPRWQKKKSFVPETVGSRPSRVLNSIIIGTKVVNMDRPVVAYNPAKVH